MSARTRARLDRVEALTEARRRATGPTPLDAYRQILEAHYARMEYEEAAEAAIKEGTACPMPPDFVAERLRLWDAAGSELTAFLMARDAGHRNGSPDFEAFIAAGRKAHEERAATGVGRDGLGGRDGRVPCTEGNPCWQCRVARIPGARRFRDLWPPAGGTMDIIFCPGPRPCAASADGGAP